MSLIPVQWERKWSVSLIQLGNSVEENSDISLLVAERLKGFIFAIYFIFRKSNYCLSDLISVRHTLDNFMFLFCSRFTKKTL